MDDLYEGGMRFEDKECNLKILHSYIQFKKNKEKHENSFYSLDGYNKRRGIRVPAKTPTYSCCRFKNAAEWRDRRPLLAKNFQIISLKCNFIISHVNIFYIRKQNYRLRVSLNSARLCRLRKLPPRTKQTVLPRKIPIAGTPSWILRRSYCFSLFIANVQQSLISAIFS